MQFSRECKLVSGILLLVVPTIMYGGITLLGILTEGKAGMTAGGLSLDETQWSLWRAGHAHAGVWVILSLVIQVLVDATRLSKFMSWIARLGTPLAAVLVSGGFFGLAFIPDFRWLLYIGSLALLVSLVATGVGLLRNLQSA